MVCIDYEKADAGKFFDVYLFNTFVVKVPKNEKVQSTEALERIATTQTLLSEKVPEVLPCYRFGDVLIMPKAKGLRADKLKEYRGVIRKRQQEVEKKINDCGYKLMDISNKNMFYDPKEDMLYMIDFHSFKKLNGR